MKRRLFTIVSVLALLLSVATAGLWVRSYWRSDQVEYCRRGIASYRVTTLNGVLGVHWRTHHADFAGGLRTYSVSAEDCRSSLGQLYFEHVTGSQGAYGFPIWLIVPVTAFPPICWLIAHRRRRSRHTRGPCACCGYDLRASKDRCPECGTPIPSNAKSCSQAERT